ncbi:MAG TPA: glycosyltransferase family 1 protein [Opitutaceae bacterium]|nr:glycosyltransferase family 1 protein [Opitutaceae bacterium]
MSSVGHSPIRILCDLASFDPSKDDGAAQRYAMEIAWSLSEAGLAEIRIVGGRRTSVPSWISGLRRRQHAREVASAIADFKPDIVHRAGHTTPAGYRGTHRIFSTFSDPATVAHSASTFESSHGHLICPSESARSQAIQVLGLPRDQVSVTPPVVRSPQSQGISRSARGNFFLFVGMRSAAANFDSLLQAVATTPTLSHTRIVAFGGGSFTGSERERFATLGLAARVTAVSGDDDALAGYYASALALVHPRISDDFGIPVLEAISNGCPVASSRTSSLPGVGGDAALYFDPTDPADIATALVHLSVDAGLRERLAAAGRVRAAQFTWKACAEKMLEVYRSPVATADSLG